MTGELLTIPTARGLMPTYLAVPTTPPPWPGVVVIHDFTGMSHDLRAQADWLTGEGFLAVAPDLYYWGSRLRSLRTIMRGISARRGRTFDDIVARAEADARELLDRFGLAGAPLRRRRAPSRASQAGAAASACCCRHARTRCRKPPWIPRRRRARSRGRSPARG